MNNNRRETVSKAVSLIEEAKVLIESVATEERDEYDNLSDKAKESDKGELIDSAATALEESLDKCDELIESLANAKD